MTSPEKVAHYEDARMVIRWETSGITAVKMPLEKQKRGCTQGSKQQPI